MACWLISNSLDFSYPVYLTPKFSVLPSRIFHTLYTFYSRTQCSAHLNSLSLFWTFLQVPPTFSFQLIIYEIDNYELKCFSNHGQPSNESQNPISTFCPAGRRFHSQSRSVKSSFPEFHSGNEDLTDLDSEPCRFNDKYSLNPV